MRPTGGAARLAAACGAGAASVSGFGDLALDIVPIAGFAVLVWLWTGAASVRAAARLGFAFGAAFFLVGVSWVFVSLHTFGMMPAPLAALATLLFCLFLALYPAAVGAAQALLPVPFAARVLVVIPALWTVAEWLRGWLFTGFPWLALGYSQADGPLAGFAPVAGVYGVTFLAAAAAGALVALARRRDGAALAGAALLVLAAAGGTALRGVEWTADEGRPLAVSLLQGNVAQEMKFVPGKYEETLALYARLAEASKGRLVVFPETALPRFMSDIDPRYLERLKRIGEARNGDLLVGVPILDDERRYYNAVVSLGAAKLQGYAKSHLVPFGEFVPPGFGWIVAVLSIPLSDFTPGAATQRPLEVAGQRVALNICYEDVFGEEIIRQLPEATLLVNVSNVAWFGDSAAPAQHLRIARMRSIETGRYMLRATNSGVTAIIDPAGRVAGRLPSFTEGILEGEVRGRSGATPFVRAGNYPVVIACLLVAGVAALAARRPRKANAPGDLPVA